MPLIKSGVIVEDPWSHLADDQALPDDLAVAITVSLARLLADGATLATRPGRLGVRLANADDPRALARKLAALDLITLDFPKFSDGRAYSQARILREELGFAGEIRATGHVLPDQAAFMARCGVDVFAASDRFTLAEWNRIAGLVTLGYQRRFGDGVNRTGQSIPERRSA